MVLQRPVKVAVVACADGSGCRPLASEAVRSRRACRCASCRASHSALAAQQIFFRDHLQNRADVLRHAAVDEHQSCPAASARVCGIASSPEDVMLRHQATAADAEFRITGPCAMRACDQLDARPDAAGILPAAAGAADPFAENRASRHDAAFASCQPPGERARPAPSPACRWRSASRAGWSKPPVASPWGCR